MPPQPDEGANEAFLDANRRLWDKLTGVHAESDYYDIEGFRAGRDHLRPYEIEEVGDVAGKDLLHLQCHIGLDTLSWARRGARATGVDFSEASVQQARALADELDIAARFIVSDVNDLPENLEDRFDIVYTSRGVVGWLPDLRRWAEVVAHFLRPGGTFYITEGHPLAQVFDDEEGTSELRLGYPYFGRGDPLGFMSHGSYAAPTADVKGLTFVWTHDMGEIVTSLVEAGLKIEFVHEFPFSDWPKPYLVRRDDGLWELPSDQEAEVPLAFSLRARRAESPSPRSEPAPEPTRLSGDRYIEANRAIWDEWTDIGMSPASFRVEDFKRGETTLQDFEIEEIGDVSGRTMVHLQCHFGLDTLSWARRGARVTGVDFSPKAIDRATALAAEEPDLDARFVCAELYDAPDVLDERFDIVYTSFGVLAWLRDLERWGSVVSQLLRPGGAFYIAEYHPITFTLDVSEDGTAPVFRHPYFPRDEPVPLEVGPGQTQYGWPYGLGAVVSSIAAELDIEFLHEFPFSESQSMPFLRRGSDGRWRMPPGAGGELPLLFSLKARKD